MKLTTSTPTLLAQALFALIGVATDHVVASGTSFAQECASGAPVAFVGADVLTMLDSVLLRRQTVLVEGGKVAAIGDPRLPGGVCRIDAMGKTLMPGLADMHAHMTESDLPLFLSNGVTLVRELNGSPTHLELRSRLARGEVSGPRLIVGSPLMTGKALQYRHRLISSAQDAYAAAHEAKDAGYEFLKIYDDLSVESYSALVEAGKSLGLPLDGHVPQAVGLERVLAAGQSIQHMDKIVFALAGHGDSANALADAQALFRGRRAWVTPTLASLRAMDIAGTREYAARFRQPEMMYVDSGSIGWWRSMIRNGNRVYTPSRFYQLETKLLPALRDAGVRYLLGTDAANPLMIAGFSVHEELATLIRDGGFTTYQALLSSTRNVGEFLGDSTIGVVRVGARADLILVNGNPLQQSAALQLPTHVMVNGRVMNRAQLNAGLKGSVRSVPER
jgi:imidazolonepropionase-like amidohydrolase